MVTNRRRRSKWPIGFKSKVQSLKLGFQGTQAVPRRLPRRFSLKLNQLNFRKENRMLQKRATIRAVRANQSALQIDVRLDS